MDTPRHTDRDRITIARVAGTWRRLHHLPDRHDELVTALRAVTTDRHHLAHAIGPGTPTDPAEHVLAEAGADMEEVARIKAQAPLYSALSSFADNTNRLNR